MSIARRCTRTACGRPAIATLTYVYSDQTVVLGPLATYAEPHAYDLCERHSASLSAPRGWEVLRLAPDPTAGGPTEDDLLALADAVREAAAPVEDRTPLHVAQRGDHEALAAATPNRVMANSSKLGTLGRRGHLRVLRGDDAD